MDTVYLFNSNILKVYLIRILAGDVLLQLLNWFQHHPDGNIRENNGNHNGQQVYSRHHDNSGPGQLRQLRVVAYRRHIHGTPVHVTINLEDTAHTVIGSIVIS